MADLTKAQIEVIAEANRLASEAQQTPVAPPPTDGAFNSVARVMSNDINAGLQGVNPVALDQQLGNAVGVLRSQYPGGPQGVDVDGVFEPLENYPADRFVTNRGPDGQVYVYPRTDEVEESGLASLGRLLGFGVISNLGPLGKAAISEKATAASDAAEVGVTPTLGMSGKTGAVIEAGIGANPLTAARATRETSRVAGELADATAGAAKKIGDASNNVGAGAAIQRGAQAFTDETSATAERLFGRVDRLIPPQTPVVAPEAAAALRETLKGLDGTSEIGKTLGVSKWAKIADELEGDGLTWEAVRALRSDIGKSLGKMTGPLADVDQGRLKLLYGKLSDDLASAAKGVSPEAGKAWGRANQFYSARQGRIETALKDVLKADTPEKAYSAVIALTKKDSPRGSVRKLSLLKKSMPEGDWNDFAATVVSKLGEAKKGQQNAEGSAFSANTFMSNWNDMTGEAKLLISGGLDKGVATELDALARVVGRFKAAGGEKNFSNTGQTLITAALIGGGGVADLGLTATAAGSSIITARMLTSRPFVRAMNRAVQRGDFSGLKSIANGKGPLAVEAEQLLRLTANEELPAQLQSRTAPLAPAN